MATGNPVFTPRETEYPQLGKLGGGGADAGKLASDDPRAYTFRQSKFIATNYE